MTPAAVAGAGDRGGAVATTGDSGAWRQDRWWLLLAFVIGCALLIAMMAPAIASRSMTDADDQLRLQEVRDWIAGQGWFDVTQYRIDPPAGAPMHWSRLVDVPVALAIVALRPWLGTASAELAALVAVPLLTLACAMALLWALARRLDGRATALPCAFLLPIDVGVLVQIRPMRIDHHGWQIVASLALVLGLAGRRSVRGAWLAGIAGALLLNISIEGLPFVVAGAGLLALRWLADPADRRLAPYLAGLAGGSIAAFLGTQGFVGAVHCDAVSPVQLAVFAAAAVGAALAVRTTGGVAVRAAALAAVGAVCAALYARGAPICLAGPFQMLDPVVRDFWYLRVKEGLPIAAQEPVMRVMVLGFPLVGLAGAVAAWVRSGNGDARRGWTDLILLLVAATLVGAMVQRASGLANVLALPGAVAVMRVLLARAQGVRAMPVRVAASALVALVAVPTLPAGIAVAVLPPVGSAGGDGAAGDDAADGSAVSCNRKSSDARLSSLPPARFLTPLDIGPAVLIDTPHSVLATGHHRAAAAMRDTILAFTGDGDRAHAIVRAHGIAYVAICPRAAEIVLYRRAVPDGFAARLADGRPPAWLVPVLPGAYGPRVWRVVR